MSPVSWQRVEGAALAAAAMVGAAALGGWWWPLATFLLFDLSALGYLAGPRPGAFTYNLVHSYWGPAVLLVWAVAAAAWATPGHPEALALAASAWTFHVGVDRAVGYGLKENDSFQHTHLGWIGRGRAARHEHEEGKRS
ncbi:DUF4260 family protein [Demequina pelophila]|uniref:DUF4260 family protein n=1 Tax=Demequina pelophila TaxID=1638984 RepID=UPI0007846CBC|nr:DUF4260 family protein [Demequina pelophila]